MTTVITPKRRHGDDGDPAGRLAGTLLSVTVATMADAPRFRRGKAYVASGAVERLEIRAGVLIGSVHGSRAEPYVATISVDVTVRPAGMLGRPEREHAKVLVPQLGEMVTTCTCPDWDDPCKHAIATLLAMANEIANDPALLVEWRCDPIGAPPRAKIGSRARKEPERHLRLVPTDGRPTNPFDSDVWRDFEGVGLEPPDIATLPHEPLTIADLQLAPVDVGAVLRSALEAIRRTQET
jgi:hypothetical protein